MTIEQAIKKAIEGGWNFSDIATDEKYLIEEMEERPSTRYRQIFLDPNFWKCLGKVMGYEEIYYCEDKEHCEFAGTPPFECQGHYKRPNNSWEAIWHEFINYLADGKSAEDYFKELICPIKEI